MTLTYHTIGKWKVATWIARDIALSNVKMGCIWFIKNANLCSIGFETSLSWTCVVAEENIYNIYMGSSMLLVPKGGNCVLIFNNKIKLVCKKCCVFDLDVCWRTCMSSCSIHNFVCELIKWKIKDCVTQNGGRNLLPRRVTKFSGKVRCHRRHSTTVQLNQWRLTLYSAKILMCTKRFQF